MKWDNKVYEENWRGFLTLDKDGLSKVQKISRDALLSTGYIENVYLSQDEFTEKTINLKIINNQGFIRIFNGDAQFDDCGFFFHVEECGCISPGEFSAKLVDRLVGLMEHKN